MCTTNEVKDTIKIKSCRTLVDTFRDLNVIHNQIKKFIQEKFDYEGLTTTQIKYVIAKLAYDFNYSGMDGFSIVFNHEKFNQLFEDVVREIDAKEEVAND